MRRRNVLSSVAAGITVSLSGCNSNSQDSGQTLTKKGGTATDTVESETPRRPSANAAENYAWYFPSRGSSDIFDMSPSVVVTANDSVIERKTLGKGWEEVEDIGGIGMDYFWPEVDIADKITGKTLILLGNDNVPFFIFEGSFDKETVLNQAIPQSKVDTNITYNGERIKASLDGGGAVVIGECKDVLMIGYTGQEEPLSSLTSACKAVIDTAKGGSGRIKNDPAYRTIVTEAGNPDLGQYISKEGGFDDSVFGTESRTRAFSVGATYHNSKASLKIIGVESEKVTVDKETVRSALTDMQGESADGSLTVNGDTIIYTGETSVESVPLFWI